MQISYQNSGNPVNAYNFYNVIHFYKNVIKLIWKNSFHFFLANKSLQQMFTVKIKTWKKKCVIFRKNNF